MGDSLTVGNALAAAFIAEGVERAFVLLGDGNMHVIPDLARRGAEIFSARHENAAVAMADGYFRRTGKVGVASVTTGPGVTNIGTSLKAAQQHRAALVVLVGEGPRTVREQGLQALEVQPLVEAAGARYQSVRSLETLAADVQHAFYRARTERLPVVLAVPLDFQVMTLPASWTYVPSDARMGDAKACASSGDIERAAQLIAGVRRPVVLAGRGVSDDAVPAVEALAERIGALLATTLQAGGMFAGDPYYLGITGGFSNATTRRLLSEADVIVAIGASLNSFTTDWDRLFPQAKVVLVNSDPMLQVASAHHPDVVLLGDAGETSAALLRAVEPNRREGWRSLDVAATIAEDLRPAMLADEPADVEPGRLDPRKVVIEVDAELPDDCVVVSGAGHFCFFTPPFLTWKRSRRFVHVAEFGAIGQAVPTSLGIALGGSPVVLFEGDASLLMVAQELDTARRYDIPVLLVILNDEALGAELHRMRDDPLACGLMQVSTPDLAYLAEAFGITGTRIDEPGQAAAAVARWRADPKPTLLDVRVSQRVVATKLVDDF